MARTRKDPDARRSDLVAAARTLFFERGVDATSIEDITRAAGVAHGTFYLYFKTKDDAVDAVMEEVARATVAEMTARADDGALPVPERLAAVLRAFMGLSRRAPSAEGDLIAHYHGPEHRAVHDRMTHTVIRELLPVVTRLIEQGVGEGAFHAADPAAAAAFALCAAEGIDLAAPQSAADADAREEVLLRHVLRGLGAASA